MTNFFTELSIEKRLTRTIRASLTIEKVGKKQLDLLKNYEKNNTQNLHVGFKYFLSTLEGFWDNFDFVLSLGKGKNRIMAFYPTRSMLESLFRIEHYINHKKDGQNRINDLEILRIYKKLYDDGNSKNENIEAVRENYQGMLTLAGLDKDDAFHIDKVSEKKLDPFPSIWELSQSSKLPGAKGLYFHYSILCEHSHGKMVASIMRNANPARSYLQMVMYAGIFSREMIKIVDVHIQGATRVDVKQAIQDSLFVING